ncbi:PBP1A family penicillin-binding protein, partial [Candidatus Saccharibacteria bacterium]|nr:PBP1A family penicillin-binding protein [Candidatus Saccharibacteria bacterium]NIV04610.1 PBP1A family penicillin-binding protein [Calditrichia bacterium]NIV73246.1 PBP1A family penicillin-binding protein [Calditrichia bacterium]NIW00602.1 PBP1A family penicillin-binding protein [Candidatus Saccharibacteria bacterium]NIW80958.1 PBP1A family penicillin-binding protein [Calditrichia bacterium]
MSDYFLNKRSQNPEDDQSPSQRSPLKRKIIRISIAVLAVLGIVYFIILILGMPDLTGLENVDPAQATRIYSADGKVIHELFKANRIWVTYDRIPKHVINAALATEDHDFFDHWGINLKRVPGAVLANLRNFGFHQGFSTITMQVARNLYVKKIGFERSITRKLREILTALQIERTYSKEEILEMYLNVSYFGRGAYGIKTAAARYFNKNVNDLSIKEGAYLIGLLKGPALYDPKKHTERALNRRNLVMYNMVDCDYLSRSTYDTLKQEPIEAEEWDSEETYGTAPYFTEYVRQQLNQLQDSLGVNVYEDGLNVFTTLNTSYQAAMDSAIQKHMPDLQKTVRQNMLPVKREEKILDSTFAELTKVQIGFVALDHHTGHILAMVGGRDFEESKFNRSVQAKRQPGSTFKPFLYAAAIDNGYTPVDKLPNQPVVITNPDGTRWTPENFSKTFGGLTMLRDGLRKSINLIAARLILDIGPHVVVNYAKRMGITTPLRPYPSLAMGSSDVIPIDMVRAFGVFANRGVRVEPIAIKRIEDRYGNVIYESQPRQTEVLSRATAFIMTDMLKDVVDRGTGGSIRWKFNWYAPAAGKTGTTNEYTDAWFVGFTPRLTAGVWVGLDSPEMKLGRGQTGSRAALPFWAEFMKNIYDTLNIPHENFIQPPEVITLDICEDSGKVATDFCPHVIKDEVFNIKYHP